MVKRGTSGKNRVLLVYACTILLLCVHSLTVHPVSAPYSKVFFIYIYMPLEQCTTTR